jgi:3-hydroxybutyryl-CoA dehydrogenase
LSETVAIIGAGPLGRWLALAAARAGFRVQLEDVMPTNLHHAQELLRQQLGPQPLAETPPALKGHGFSRADGTAEGGGGFNPRIMSAESEGALAPEESAEGTGFRPYNDPAISAGALAPEGSVKGTGFSPYIKPAILDGALAPEGNISQTLPVAFVSTIEEAVRNADLVIDCVPDELESKLEILWLLDRMAPPRTVLATPTTRLSIADLANCTYRPTKCIAIAAEASTLTGKTEAAGTSPEILLRTTPQTAPETIALLDHFWRQLGFAPIFAPDPAESPSS